METQLNPRESKPAGPSSHSRGKVLHHSFRPARLIARWVRFVGPSGAYPGTLLSPARPVTASVPTDLEQVPAQVTVAPATTPVLAVVVEDPAATRVAAYLEPLPIVRVEELCGRQSDRSYERLIVFNPGDRLEPQFSSRLFHSVANVCLL